MSPILLAIVLGPIILFFFLLFVNPSHPKFVAVAERLVPLVPVPLQSEAQKRWIADRRASRDSLLADTTSSSFTSSLQEGADRDRAAVASGLRGSVARHVAAVAKAANADTTAILVGPSGTGKTTLLLSLADTKVSSTGTTVPTIASNVAVVPAAQGGCVTVVDTPGLPSLWSEVEQLVESAPTLGASLVLVAGNPTTPAAISLVAHTAVAVLTNAVVVDGGGPLCIYHRRSDAAAFAAALLAEIDHIRLDTLSSQQLTGASDDAVPLGVVGQALTWEGLPIDVELADSRDALDAFLRP